jgi:hypothetical protein
MSHALINDPSNRGSKGKMAEMSKLQDSLLSAKDEVAYRRKGQTVRRHLLLGEGTRQGETEI